MTCERCGGQLRESAYVAGMWVHASFRDWQNAPHNPVAPAMDEWPVADIHVLAAQVNNRMTR